jgi:hypothetical protein
MLVAESYTGGKMALQEDRGINGKKTINSEVWEMIEKLYKGEVRNNQNSQIKSIIFLLGMAKI